MPADGTAQTSSLGIVRTPDQLQQSKRPEATRPDAPEAPRGAEPGAEPREEGVLGQLRTERAHD